MLWLLLSVQLLEILWVVFNYVGLERTTESTVASVSDIHLAFMPYSHSIVSGMLLGTLAWLVLGMGWRNEAAGLAVGLGIVSHLILDLITHAPDIAVAPGMAAPKFGLGFYRAAPLLAFFIEIAYGVFCWWIYRGGRALLMVIVTIIAVQIAVTLTLVGVFSRSGVPDNPSGALRA